jgi:hypothetical protein
MKCFQNKNIPSGFSPAVSIAKRIKLNAKDGLHNL